MRSRIGFVAMLLALALLVVPPGLTTGQEPTPQPRIQVEKSQVDLLAGKDLVARYVIDEKVAKPYFFPLQVAGRDVTRSWPPPAGEAKDHPHQKSAWFCHGDVIPEGLELKQKIRGVDGVDFWSEAKGHGRIVCTRVDKPTSSRGGASVVTANEWRTADGQKILDETRTIGLYPLPAGNLIVLDIDLVASTVPITFGDTKEGSLGVRVRESLRVDRGKGQLVNAEGKSGEGAKSNAKRDGCWGLVSAWCDYSGPVDDAGTVAGIAVFADPGNRIDTAWHARNYGLLAANPFGRNRAGFPDRKGKTDLVQLKKGEHLRLRYALYMHKGDAKAGKVAEAFAEFAKLGKGG
jgi:hypothetical protein